ncbi:MAG: zinc metallopeptidase [Candidatus Melainabacteria bacterium]|jgi:Zn-dependent membrane protease YugP|nr:zinc metallopeptidase [Candidatus Melainabacteria bacterium]
MFFMPMGFHMDPIQLLISLIGIPLTFLPQLWVKSTYKKFSLERNQRNMSGVQVAKDMLSRNQIFNVSVEETPGELSDHYSPTEHVVRLSPDVYHGTSISSVAIAAHEVGHAIQHAQGYVPVVIRGQMFPIVNLGSQLGPMIFFGAIMLKLFMHMSGPLPFYLGILGIIFFGAAVAFHLVTLPVELDASARALKQVEANAYLSREELPKAKKVLTTAAFTYIAAATYALLELVGMILRLLAMQNQSQREE